MTAAKQQTFISGNGLPALRDAAIALIPPITFVIVIIIIVFYSHPSVRPSVSVPPCCTDSYPPARSMKYVAVKRV